MQEGLQTINAQNILETSNMRHYTSNSSVRHCQFLSYIWFQVIHTQKDGLSWTFWITSGFFVRSIIFRGHQQLSKRISSEATRKMDGALQGSESPRTAISSNLQFVSKIAFILLAAIHSKQPPEKKKKKRKMFAYVGGSWSIANSRALLWTEMKSALAMCQQPAQENMLPASEVCLD